MKHGFLIGLVLPILPTIPITIASCSNNIQPKYSRNDIGGLGSSYDDKRSNILTKVNQIKKTNPELLDQKTILITTNAKVNDKSFNQLAWEAISRISLEIGNENNSYYETNKMSQATQNEAYDYALAKGYKIWVLTGFQQENFLKNWLEMGNNRNKFNQANIKIISVDWYNDSFLNPGQILGLNFRTQEASFVVGYSAAKLLGTKFSGEDNKKNRYLNSFGGGDFASVTNFNYGFYDGIRRWNKEQKSNDTKIKISQPQIELWAGFGISETSISKVNIAVDSGCKAILPVAGPLISPTIDRVKEKKQDQWIIGVDTDQTLTFPSEKHLIMTSIEKKIAIVIYKTLLILYGINDDGNIENNSYIKEFLNGKSLNVIEGYSENFVDTSKSFLKDFGDEFNEMLFETKKIFFDGYEEDGKKIPPILSSELTNEDKGKTPFELQNVKLASMTANNKNDYFIKAIEEINNWN